MVSPPLHRRAIPADAAITHWTAPGGFELRRFDWPVRDARGAILFQAGRGDIFEKYLELFAHWHAAGWSVTSFDWRGQGGSGRLTPSPFVGDIDDFVTYVADLGAFWADWTRAAPGPHVVMGHSMGGHLVLRALTEGAVAPAAAVLVAPMLGLRSPLGAVFGERMARWMCALGDPARAAWKGNERPATTHTRQQLLTHDLERYDDELWWQSAKPDLMMGAPSWRWLARAFESTRRQRADPALALIRVPVLMLVADDDRLVCSKATLAVAAKIPGARVLRFGRESAHEVLREADGVRDRAIAAIDAFLDDVAPSAAPA